MTQDDHDDHDHCDHYDHCENLTDFLDSCYRTLDDLNAVLSRQALYIVRVSTLSTGITHSIE